MSTKHLISILFLLLMVACQDKEWANKDTGRVRVFADTDMPETRISFTESGATTFVSWKDGDMIGIYSEGQPLLNYTASVSKDGVTEFAAFDAVLEDVEGKTVYAYYPSYLGDDCKDGIVPMHSFVEGFKSDFTPFLYAEGKITNGELKLCFKHLFPYLKLTLTAEAFADSELSTPIDFVTLISGDGVDQNPIAFYNGTFDLRNKTIVSGDKGIGISMYISDDINSGHDITSNSLTLYTPILPQKGGTLLQIRVNHQLLITRMVPEGGFQAGHVYSLNTSRKDIVELQEEHRQLLIDFYNATGGDQWTNKENWLSDKPIYEWYGVNNSYKTPYLCTLDLPNNNLVGELPESVATMMDYVETLSLFDNILYGVIPKSIRYHPRWNLFGWNILQQNIYLGGRFDMTDINLRVDDMKVEYLDGGTTTLYSLLAKNEVSHIMVDTPSDAQANQHLSYHNKGFGTIIFHSEAMGETRDATIERTKDYPIKDMVRLWESAGVQLGFGLGALGSTYLLDNQGNVIDYLTRDWSISEEVYNAIIDSILYARLGEPEEHPIFSTEYYISSDYSRDGEVVTLQTATEGQGIDLVLMGDAYVDRDMENGGKYEEDMKKSMEYFFSIEPYKSFRNRFNVYTVKVISGTEYLSQKLDKMQLRLGAFNETGTDYFSNDEICYEYAGKIDGVDLDKVTIVNVVNNPNSFYVSGYSNMYDSGASVSHVYMGGPSEIIVHEGGGHGFAKLLDEYIYDGAASTMTDADKSDFCVNYTEKGWGANLDVTNSPTEVKWAHLLADPLYKNEIGIHEGAWLWLGDIYRPSVNSVMNNDYTWFNAPSREAIYEAIMQQSEGSGWVYRYEDFVTYDAINRSSIPATRSFTSKDKRKVIHRPPVFVKGTWRDAVERK